MWPRFLVNISNKIGELEQDGLSHCSLIMMFRAIGETGNTMLAWVVDPRKDRMFDVTKQAINYDSNATYISHWIPALKKLPTDLRFTPFGLSLEEQKTYDFYLDKDYPRPIINHPLINRYMNDK